MDTEKVSGSDEIDIVSGVSGERAKNFAARLAEIQMRIPGSENEMRAAEIIAEEFRKLGLDVSLEEFKAISWEHESSRIIISNGSAREFETQLMPYSPPIPADGAKGIIKRLRFGFSKEFSGLGEDRYIVFIDWNDDFGLVSQALAAAQSGKNIAALGVVSDFKNAHRIDSVPMMSKPIPFPIFSISKDEGRIIDEISSRSNIIGRFDGKSRIIPDAVSANVIGRKEGTAEPELRVLVSGHHDGWFQGANDNLSAVASVLEVAYTLKDVETRRSIEFISFGSEESGTDGYQYYLWGSRQYLEKHGNEIDRIACVLNTEFAGACNSDYLFVDCTPDLLSFFDTVFESASDYPSFARSGVKFGATIPPNSQADQLPFAWRGASSALIYWSWFDQYHSDLDSIDILESEKLEIFSELLCLSCLRAAQSDVMPLSLTRYARVLRTGHSDITSQLSNKIRKVVIPGLDNLKRLSCEGVDLSPAFKALDSLTKTASSFERTISLSRRDDLATINKKLIKVCQLLNRSLCRIGGIFGEDPFFPGYLPYMEELKKIEAMIDNISRFEGADITPELKKQFHALYPPEIDISEYDLYPELESLSSKKGRLERAIQGEVERLAGALAEADNMMRA